jgi:hypothetical protein
MIIKINQRRHNMPKITATKINWLLVTKEAEIRRDPYLEKNPTQKQDCRKALSGRAPYY